MNITPEEKDLTALLDSLSWEERAMADSGIPIALAPATDADGNGWWNVWVSGDQSSPHSFPSQDEAVTFATRKSDDGMKVHTDF